MELPTFRYYRDPYGDDAGAFDATDEECECCGRATGYRYRGFIYADDEPETICPWCIADGSTAEKFEGTFVDDSNLTDCRPEAIEELTERTPEFFAFQQARWLVHCGEPAVYIGVAGYDELVGYGAQTIQSVKNDLPAEMSEEKKTAYVQSLHKDGSGIAHVFECLHCRQVVAYGEHD